MSATLITLTAERYYHTGSTGQRTELVRGEIVAMMPPGGIHSIVQLRVGHLLTNWADAGPGGVVGTDGGFILTRDPDTVRSPDVYYVRADRVPTTGPPEAFWEIAPDVAVEIVSPSNTGVELRERLRDFLTAGTRQVWDGFSPHGRGRGAHARRRGGDVIWRGSFGWWRHSAGIRSRRVGFFSLRDESRRGGAQTLRPRNFGTTKKR